MSDTTTTEPVALEELFARTLTALRDGDEQTASELIERITSAAGASADEERPRFEAAAAGDAEAEEELLDDLQAMGALSLIQLPAPAPRVYNFAIPERGPSDDPLAHLLPSPEPGRLLG